MMKSTRLRACSTAALTSSDFVSGGNVRADVERFNDPVSSD
jgi:hypothetical protein